MTAMVELFLAASSLGMSTPINKYACFATELA
jgi:hypothetical protein